MKRLSLVIDNQQIEVFAQKIAGELWFHYNGTTYQFKPEGRGASAGGGAQQDPTRIVAPMPGKIIKVNKSEGEKVKEGETVVVMEAMKMEYNLKATQPMRIVKIRCKEQQTVALGVLLVEMEEDNG